MEANVLIMPKAMGPICLPRISGMVVRLFWDCCVGMGRRISEVVCCT